ncbi:MAG: hypothetical protein NVSMB46_06700 [Candidatus Saccharimonadales bacterium]
MIKLYIEAGGIATVLLILSFFAYKFLPKHLKQDNFNKSWKELQLYCKDKATWPNALIKADRLLDNALKKRRFKGKSMGERLVSAQRSLSNNDGVWFAHNLCKKVAIDPQVRIKEEEIKQALIGFRQALRDIGALPDGETRDT